MSESPGVTVAAEVEAAARALESEPGFPRALVERVRAATGWLGVTDTAPDDVRHAALLLSRQARVSLEPPMAGPRPAGRRDRARWRVRRLVKEAVRRLVGWYVRFLGAQVGALGQATARLGLAVAERTERLQADQVADRAAVQAELDALRARVARLEAELEMGDRGNRGQTGDGR